MEREGKIERAKERGKNEGRLGKRTREPLNLEPSRVPSSSSPVSPRFFPALSLAFFFAHAPLSERLEQAMSGH